MSHFKVVCSHLCLKEVGLTHHPVDILVHYRFSKDLVVQSVALRVLVEERSKLPFFEITSKFVHTSYKLSKTTIFLVFKVEVR